MAVTCEDLDTVAGATLYISATIPATDDAAGYGALTWTEVAGSTDIPSISGSYNDVGYDLLAERVTCHKPGQFNPGGDTFNFARKITDAGQALVKTQFDAGAATSVKILYSNGDIDYCVGYFQATPAQNGTADNVRAKQVTLQWSRKPIEVAA